MSETASKERLAVKVLALDLVNQAIQELMDRAERSAEHGLVLELGNIQYQVTHPKQENG